MATLTLKQVPDELLDRLRKAAARQRRSLNQQTIYILEQALTTQRSPFLEALDAFFREEGRPDDDTSAALTDLRSDDAGREIDL